MTLFMVPQAPYPPPSVELINLEVLTAAQLSRQRKLVTLRSYYEGVQGSKVSERLREFMPSISKGFEFSLNIVSVIIQAVTEYLCVKGWDSDDVDLIDWVEVLWSNNKMDSVQDDVHEQALVDGESFLMVYWDNDKGRPVWVPSKAYTDPSIGGDGSGCAMVYPQNDTNLDPLYAIKRWSEMDEKGNVTDFKTLYFPDRVEKYSRTNSVYWEPRPEEDGSWPVPWIDDEGNPLGIAVIHFINKRGASEVDDVLAIQDSVNKSAIDTLVSADLTAFRIYISIGWIPTTDGKEPNEDRSNWAIIEPGMIYGTTRTDAKFNAIDPPKETVEGLSSLTQQFLIWGAIISGTPVTRVITTKLIASDETLKQQEKPLESRVALRRALFGYGWVSAVDLSVKLEKVFGERVFAEGSKATPIWGSRLQDTAKDLEALEVKGRLGIPREQLWREMGYSTRKIAAMKEIASASRQEPTNTNDEENQDGSNQPDFG